jgi:hypothetical protein
MTRKIALTLAEAEHALRKAAEEDAMWYKRNTFAVFMYGIMIGASVATVATYLMLTWK